MENKYFRILAIDDTDDNLLVLKALMEEFFPKSEFLMAHSGKEGLEMCLKEMPDVVLSDVVMPLMDGYEVCKSIKGNPATRHIPVVMITAARTDTEARIKALNFGADAFLSKPVDEAELKAQILAMLKIKEAEDNKLSEKGRLEKLIHERTFLLEKELQGRRKTEEQLQLAVANLERSKQAALNLMDDVQSEMRERQKVQEILIISEERFRSLFENTPLGMLSFDEQGVINACNDKFVEIIGSSRQKLIGLDMKLLKDVYVVEALKMTLNGQQSTYEGLYSSQTVNKQTMVKIRFAPIFGPTKEVNGGVGIVEDTTEQFKTESNRRELEERFKKSFYGSPVAISITHLEKGVFVDVNDAYCRLTGYSRDQLIGKNIIEMGIITEPFRSKVIHELKKNNYLRQAEIPLRIRNGEQRIILVSLETYELSGVVYLLSTLIDITDIKQYEQNLTKLTRAVEQSPVSIVITDIEGNIEYVNPRLVETTGFLPSELIGKNPRIWGSGETPTEAYKEMYETIARGETWSGEFHNKKKTGELYWESATIGPVYNDEGVITHYLGVKEDVTEQKALRLAMMESEKLYRNIFMNSPAAMWIYDTNTLDFVEVNETAVNMYGYSREEFLSMTLKDIRPSEDIPALLEDVKNKSVYQAPKQWRHILKDGSIIDVEISSHIIPTPEERKLRMVMATDVTERLKARDTILEAMAMAEASDMLKTNFLNNISHEVRTPLNGIMGATMLISDPDIDRADLPELVDIINLSTVRLIQTVTDYMDISLITSGNMEVNYQDVMVLDLVNRVQKNIISDCQAKSIAFVNELPENAENDMIKTDSEVLGKALSHLLTNAVKFTQEGSVTFGYHHKEEELVFYIKDTGIGIAKEKQTKIFEYFTQEDDGSSRRFEGSGLGLSITKGLALLLGGDVTLQSEKGVGSVFYLQIPSKISQAIPVEVNAVEPVTSQPVILIAEDEDSNFQVLQLLLLKSFNAIVIHAKNGLEAVEIAKSEQKITLIIMDIKMPVMNGFEATKQIKAFNEKVPIVAITAFAMSGDEKLALDAGCNDYLAKPVNRIELFEMFEKFGVKRVR
ncbi:MAG: hypothetical protein CVT92_08810 [Bacteroidetes bacterium HGW-Bacteroidetes-1]|jgi:PAS domain S-box-containing protein|nr:MAG: hypothetical protein CVT92_08810 [Bacteroidetes bacterium HGW-Bacteroidetes-1]